jgi:hypothetical protein
MFNPMNAIAAVALKSLTDAELATFRVCLEYPDQRTQCRSKSFYHKVECLFSDEGERLHETTFEAICAVVARRLAKG